jgi:hypothetical protein
MLGVCCYRGGQRGLVLNSLELGLFLFFVCSWGLGDCDRKVDF